MNSASIRGDWVGRVVDGRFPLLQWIGGSEEAGVYLTELSGQSQRAIIKLVPADSDDAEIRMTAWVAAANLSHPNLMQVFASGRCEIDSVPLLYVVTEYADEILAEILLERALTPQETREMLGPALDALAYLHERGFVHARLKPRNIMAAGDRLKLTTDGLLLAGAIGKPSLERTVYDAPETVQGRIGPATDVWSLGATLAAVLTQRPPAWKGGANVEPVVSETVPQPFAAVARECLRIDPARRCTLEEIKAHLEPGTGVPRPAKNAGRTPLAKRRVAALIGAAAILLAGIGILSVLSHRTQPPTPATEEQNVPAATPAPATAPIPAPATAPPRAPAPASVPATSPAEASTAAPAATAAPALAAASAPEATSAPAPPPTPAPAQVSEAAPAPTQAQEATPPPLETAEGAAPSGTALKGAVIQQVQPDAAPGALRTISGTVKVAIRLEVDENGNVTGAAFQSAGPSQYFANKALDAALRWKFKPAQADGRAVPTVWILDFQFKQSGINVIPTETAP